MFKNKKAITLIALVVTIIILLILSGVSINFIFENEGVFSKMQYAVEKYTNAQNYEETEISKFTNNIDILVNTRDNGMIGTSNIIGDFKPESIETNGKYILIKANATNMDYIKGYVYLLNNKVVSVSREDTYLYDSLNYNTDYKISVVAIDIDGNIKKSSELPIKTLNYILNRYVLIEVKNPNGAGSINELEVYNYNNQKCSYSIAHMYDSRTGGGFVYDSDPREIWCSSNLNDGASSFRGQKYSIVFI